MNGTTRRRGRDGKPYLAAPLTRAERNRARWLAHNLVHRDGMSIRAAQQVMASYGCTRSIGAITRDLRGIRVPALRHLNA